VFFRVESSAINRMIGKADGQGRFMGLLSRHMGIPLIFHAKT